MIQITPPPGGPGSLLAFKILRFGSKAHYIEHGILPHLEILNLLKINSSDDPTQCFYTVIAAPCTRK